MNVTLRELLEADIIALDRFYASEVSGIRETFDRSNVDLNKRLETMNQFRDSLRDQASRLATKEEVSLRFDLFESRTKTLELRSAEERGRTAMVSAFVAGAISLVAVIAGVFLNGH